MPFPSPGDLSSPGIEPWSPALQAALYHLSLPGKETQVQPQGQEDPLEKRMATRSSILAWRIAWTEEPGGIQSVGSQRVGHD